MPARLPTAARSFAPATVSGMNNPVNLPAFAAFVNATATPSGIFDGLVNPALLGDPADPTDAALVIGPMDQAGPRAASIFDDDASPTPS